MATAPWKRKNPRTTHVRLSPESIERARAAAAAAGRRYPNLIDNMNAAREQALASAASAPPRPTSTAKAPGGARKPTAAKRATNASTARTSASAARPRRKGPGSPA